MTTLDLDDDRRTAMDGDPLSAREWIVLGELTRHTTLEQIARHLFVSRNTVKTQVRSIYRKIGASTRAEAVAWAKAAGVR